MARLRKVFNSGRPTMYVVRNGKERDYEDREVMSFLPAQPLQLHPSNRVTLESMVRKRTLAQRSVFRARIILILRGWATPSEKQTLPQRFCGRRDCAGESVMSSRGSTVYRTAPDRGDPQPTRGNLC